MTYPAETITIKLYTPVEPSEGVRITELTMREPLVRDRIKFSKTQGTDEEKDASMMADLCGVELPIIWSLTAADYAQVEMNFKVFMLPPPERAAARKKQSKKG